MVVIYRVVRLLFFVSIIVSLAHPAVLFNVGIRA